jgi:hypothetical protein
VTSRAAGEVFKDATGFAVMTPKNPRAEFARSFFDPRPCCARSRAVGINHTLID